jgi:hypothetical protein
VGIDGSSIDTEEFADGASSCYPREAPSFIIASQSSAQLGSRCYIGGKDRAKRRAVILPVTRHGA